MSDGLDVFGRPRVNGASYLSARLLIFIFMSSRTDVGLWQYSTLTQVSIILDRENEDGRYAVLQTEGFEHIIKKTV